MKTFIPAFVILCLVLVGWGALALYQDQESVVSVTATSTLASTTTVNPPVIEEPVKPIIPAPKPTPAPVPTPITPAPQPQPVVVTPPEPVAVVYTSSEVALHANADSCWTIINDVVYDITEYVPKHPAGKVILKACGREATKMFESVSAHRGTDRTLARYELGPLTQ